MTKVEMRKFTVWLEARDPRGVKKDIHYEEVKAVDASQAIDAAIKTSEIPLSEIDHISVYERDR